MRFAEIARKIACSSKCLVSKRRLQNLSQTSFETGVSGFRKSSVEFVLRQWLLEREDSEPSRGPFWRSESWLIKKTRGVAFLRTSNFPRTTTKQQPPVQLDYATRWAIIGRACSTSFISTPLHTAIYPIKLNHRENIQMSKPDMTHLRRFRSGHHPALRRWQHLTNRSEEATCRICNDEDDTYDHLLLRCPAFDADCKRLDLGVSIDELTCFPMRAQALAVITTTTTTTTTTTNLSSAQDAN